MREHSELLALIFFFFAQTAQILLVSQAELKEPNLEIRFFTQLRNLEFAFFVKQSPFTRLVVHVLNN